MLVGGGYVSEFIRKHSAFPRWIKAKQRENIEKCANKWDMPMCETLSNPACDWIQLHETLSSPAVDDKRNSLKSQQLFASFETFSSLTFNSKLYISLASIFSSRKHRFSTFLAMRPLKIPKRHCPCLLDMILEFLFLHYWLHHDDSNFVIAAPMN